MSDPPGRSLLMGLHVLVADGDHDTREMLGEFLNFFGAAVTTTESSASARVVLDRIVPDVIISDVSLPDEDGYAFLGHVRTMPRAAHVPAIALTGQRGHEKERSPASHAGFQAYLEKPVDLEALLHLIKDLAPGVEEQRE